MQIVINTINLLGWVLVLFSVGFNLFFNPQQFIKADISFYISLVQAIQIFQISDMVLTLVGKAQGSIVGAFFQILGRLIVCIAFMTPQTHRLKFAMVAILWSIADINRYLYYLFKNSPLTGFLRYNGFLILYPAGVTGQILVINNFIENNPQLATFYIYFIRFVQVCIVLGMLFLYRYMLKSRSKYMNNLSKGQNISKSTEQKSKSPKRETKRQ